MPPSQPYGPPGFAEPPGRPDVLPQRPDYTVTWGQRATILAGLFDAAATGPFAPFTPSPDTGNWKPLVELRAGTDIPSTGSRDFTVAITAAQKYENNPGIINAAGTRISTPVANQQSANRALFGRVTIGRGGISNVQTFIIPAHGIALHVAADSVRVEVGFFPGLTQFATDAAFRGLRATGWEVQGGVAVGIPAVDLVRSVISSDPDADNDLSITIPQFSRRVHLFHPNPDMFVVQWRDFNGNLVPQAPATGSSYGTLQPIPVDAVVCNPFRLQPLQTTNAILQWERQA